MSTVTSHMTDADRDELEEIKRTIADAKKRRQRVFARVRQRKRRAKTDG